MAERKRKDNKSNRVMDGTRRMPHSLEAEQSVLSCCLIDNNAAVYIIEQLKKESFFSEAHKIIFEAMTSVLSGADIHSILDVVTLTDELERMGQLNSAGGFEYIAKLSTYVPNAANHRTYCDIVKSKALLRSIIETCSDAVNEAYDNDDASNVLTRAEAELYNLSKNEEKHSLSHIKTILPDVLTELDKLKDPAHRRGIPTGFENLDRILNGLHNSDLILLAARPGVGKTALSMNIIGNIVLGIGQNGENKEKFRCAVFNLEMSRNQLVQRLLCQFSGVSMSKAVRGNMSPDDWKKMMAANKRLSDAGLYVDDTSYLRPQEIFNKCLRMKREQGLDVILIDYLQLMTPNKDRSDSRAQEVADMTRYLKTTAKELNVPIILLSQLSREAEKNKDKPPQLSHLRESGSIEQDADIVLFIHQTTPEDQRELKEQKVDIVVAKHRNGGLGKAHLLWYPEQVMFRDDLENTQIGAMD